MTTENELTKYLYKRNGEIAGLKDVMKLFIDIYPGDIFTSEHPIHIFRNWCLEHKDKLEKEK